MSPDSSPLTEGVFETVRTSAISTAKGANWRRYLDIVLFKAYADLQSERQRTYLGFLWWIFEPLMYMTVMWILYTFVLHSRTEDMILFLLTGLIFWQWFKSGVSHGAIALMQANSLIQLIPLPPVIFPLVPVLADTFKFFVVLGLLLIVLALAGHTPSLPLLALPVLILAQLLFVSAVAIWAAAFVPFLPDLRFVIESVLMAMMFLSGIFFDLNSIAEPARQYFMLIPTAFLLNQARSILIYQQWPDWGGLVLLISVSIVLCVMGMLVMEHFRRHYPKLPR